MAGYLSLQIVDFLTGRYQQRVGMDNALYYQEMGRGLPVGGLTIGDALLSVGYATGLSGKWHVGYDFERQPNQQGFEHFYGLLGGNHHYFEHMDRIAAHLELARTLSGLLDDWEAEVYPGSRNLD